jgi:hypothetical protein
MSHAWLFFIGDSYHDYSPDPKQALGPAARLLVFGGIFAAESLVWVAAWPG